MSVKPPFETGSPFGPRLDWTSLVFVLQQKPPLKSGVPLLTVNHCTFTVFARAGTAAHAMIAANGSPKPNKFLSIAVLQNTEHMALALRSNNLFITIS